MKVPPRARVVVCRLGAVALSLSLCGCGYTIDTGPRTPPKPVETSGGESTPRPPRIPPAEGPTTNVIAAAEPLPVGTTLEPFVVDAPDRTLDTRLSLRGGPVVLVFFIGEWCMYCKHQLADIQSRLEEFRAAGAQVWAVSSEGEETTRSLARELHLTFPVAGDPDMSVIARFGVIAGGTGAALPSVFVLTADGARVKVAWRKIGAAPDDRASIDTILGVLRALPAAPRP